jgi:hypothetical protein
MLNTAYGILQWTVWTLALALVIALAAVCLPSIIVWCLLFDAD